VSTLEQLGPEGYASEISPRVYAALTAQAAAVVRSGYSVIADAVFARLRDREAIERAALDAGVSFSGLWLEAPEPLLVDRLRRRAVDASDADAGVLRMQEARGTGQVRWPRLDASATAETVLISAASRLAAATAAA
jgi:predicted kinase